MGLRQLFTPDQARRKTGILSLLAAMMLPPVPHQKKHKPISKALKVKNGRLWDIKRRKRAIEKESRRRNRTGSHSANRKAFAL